MHLAHDSTSQVAMQRPYFIFGVIFRKLADSRALSYNLHGYRNPKKRLPQRPRESRKQVYMATLNKRDWMDNLHDVANNLASMAGSDVVMEYLWQHYHVHSVDDLAVTDYDQAWDDLDFMLNEMK